MSDESPPLVSPSPSAAAARSLVADVRQLAADGKTLLEAELAYHKSRAAVAGDGVKGVAAWGALALALVFFAVMVLVMGLLLGLSQAVGPWGATGIVVTGVAIAAALSGLIARQRWKRTAALLSESQPEP